MLKVFRDNLKHLSWILWAVIALFVLLVFVDYGSLTQPGGAAGTTAATVGGQTVSMQEFERSYRALEAQYQQSFGEQFTPELARQMRLPLQALDQLINDKILLEEAEQMGLRVSDAEVQQAILEVDAFKDEKGQFIGQELYSQVLQSNGFTVAEFERQVREDILRDKLRNALLASAYVSEAELQEAYRAQVERAKIRYVLLPGSRFAAETQVTPQEMQSYYQAHKEEFRLPEQREAAYLLVENEKLAGQVKIDDAELRKFYDDNKAEFTQEEQVRARHILVMVNDQQSDAVAKGKIEQAQKRLQAGEDFAKVAAEVSEDTASKAQGGDLSYFGRGSMVKEFEDAAFGAQPGQLVGPVKSTYGYHLIEVTDRRPGGSTPFEQAREQIRARLAAERVQTLAQAKATELARQLQEDTPANAKELQAVAEKNPGVSFAETGRFGRQEPVSGLGFSPAFTNAAFELEKGKVSEPVQVQRGWAIAYLTAVHEPRVPELKDVEARVRMAVTADKQKKVAVERLQAARAGGKTLDQVAAELGIQVQETAEFGSQGAIPGLGLNPQLAKAALSMKQGETGGPIATSQGAVLFQVTERKAFDPAQFATAKEQTRSTLQQEKAARLLASLVEQRRKELGVEYDGQLLQTFGVEGAGQPS
ncbi:MAG TPA: peptidyl-prolyl cis-trans isomerase [Thermoanaerobaculia bacterium]|nr:peptidyl-prolyl cis-trans isomerase [Thermoanaerobaculia bacterium]